MVDWEDVWEDFDLKRGITILVLGILVIGGGVFVLRDYFLAKSLNDQLIADQASLDSFFKDLKPPKMKNAEMKTQIDELTAQSKSQRKVLPNAIKWDDDDQSVFDQAKIEAEIRQTAGKTGVRMNNVEVGEEAVDQDLLYQKFKITFEGTNNTTSNFISGIKNMTFLSEIEPEPISPQGQVSINVRFFKFDVDTWKKANDCEATMVPPAVEPPEVGGVYFFKGNLVTKRSLVLEQQGKVDTELKNAKESCTLELQMKMLADRLALIQKKSK